MKAEIKIEKEEVEAILSDYFSRRGLKPTAVKVTFRENWESPVGHREVVLGGALIDIEITDDGHEFHPKLPEKQNLSAEVTKQWRMFDKDGN